MKPNESTGELLARITNTMVIIKESYATYENKVEACNTILMVVTLKYVTATK
jgi:hypothetical protein